MQSVAPFQALEPCWHTQVATAHLSLEAFGVSGTSEFASGHMLEFVVCLVDSRVVWAHLRRLRAFGSPGVSSDLTSGHVSEFAGPPADGGAWRDASAGARAPPRGHGRWLLLVKDTQIFAN